jgi:uncharacterized protein (DUF433 family)
LKIAASGYIDCGFALTPILQAAAVRRARQAGQDAAGAKRGFTKGNGGRRLRAGACAMPDLDWSQCDAVESVPGKMSGAWVFKGTRMPVKTVFENLEAGMSLREITEVFDVTPEEIRAVLHFASESLTKAPAYADDVFVK